MPKSKNIYKYPSTFLDQLEKMAETHHPATFVFPSQKAAEDARFQYYGLIEALRHSNHSLYAEVRGLKFILQALKDSPREKRVLSIFFVDETPEAEVYKKMTEQYIADAEAHAKANVVIPDGAIVVEEVPSTAQLLGVEKPEEAK